VCLVGGFFFFSCKNEKKIIYNPKDTEFVVKKYPFQIGEAVVEKKEYLRIYTQRRDYFTESKKEGFEVEVLLTNSAASAYDLISVTTKVLKKDAGNEFSVELPRENDPVFYFGYPGYNLELEEMKMPENLFTLVPDTIANKIASFNFRFEDKFQMNDYPDELKILVTIKSRTGEENFEKILRKTEFKPRKMFDIKY
jgi:hypothetical protein